ncbi:hypothetical protein [Streptomyces sp. NPDC001985]|uniref:hypothetical protein n=1 Tax=Streptomyces sp. NPDC001985 TaxID=3154406 RepID=UPI00332EBFC2
MSTPTPAPPPGEPTEGGSSTGGDASAGTPAVPTPAPPAVPADSGDSTDWKAMARQWEKRAKENSTAAAELERHRKAAMTEQERAVAEAETKGRTAAASEYGTKLAAAEFRAAVAAAGVDLGEAADLIDTKQFVGDDGEVDTKAIKAAVTKLTKLAPPRGAGRSGGDLSGAGGSGDQHASLDKKIAEATAAKQWSRVISLKRQRAAQTT